MTTAAAGGVGAGGMVALRVRAELAAGVAQAAPWAPALDGILASLLWAPRKAVEVSAGEYRVRALEREYPVDLELPLARCPIAGNSEVWHWLATCGKPEEVASGTVVHAWTGRVDARDLEVVADRLPRVVSARQGVFRARRMPLLVTPCRVLVWRAVGDPDAIRDLLGGVTSIGKKRAAGEGRVVRWEVFPEPGADPARAGHLHSDGSLGRPTPPACLDELGATVNGGWGTAGIRPPYMHRSRQHHVALPAPLDGQ